MYHGLCRFVTAVTLYDGKMSFMNSLGKLHKVPDTLQQIRRMCGADQESSVHAVFVQNVVLVTPESFQMKHGFAVVTAVQSCLVTSSRASTTGFRRSHLISPRQSRKSLRVLRLKLQRSVKTPMSPTSLQCLCLCLCLSLAQSKAHLRQREFALVWKRALQQFGSVCFGYCHHFHCVLAS